MELNDLLVSTSKIDAIYMGRTFRMRVYTEKLTPTYKAQLLAAAAEAAEDEERKDENVQLLAELIESWTDEKDEPIVLNGQNFPPSYENLMKLSYPLIATLTRSITTFLGDLANPTKETN
jgi:hypothetical protein